MPIRVYSPAIFAPPSAWRRPSPKSRAGPGASRAPGEVLIQTEFPEHPLLTRLIAEGYESFAASALKNGARPAGHRTRASRCCARKRRTACALDEFLRAAAAAGLGLNEAACENPWDRRAR